MKKIVEYEIDFENNVGTTIERPRAKIEWFSKAIQVKNWSH